MKPWWKKNDPSPLELECPHCRVPAGVLCKGPGVVRGLHARRKEWARSIRMEAGAFGRGGQVTCPRCKASPGGDCTSPSGSPRRAGPTPLFHDERLEEAHTTKRRLTRPPGHGGYRLVTEEASP